MGRRTSGILFVLAIVVIVVTVDIVFFRHHFTQRLIANVAIVLAFATFYHFFLRNR